MAWFDRNRHDSGEWTGFLEPGVKLEGRLESSGTFRIDSSMKGTLVSGETLILGEHASVEGRDRWQQHNHQRAVRRGYPRPWKSRTENQSHRDG